MQVNQREHKTTCEATDTRRDQCRHIARALERRLTAQPIRVGVLDLRAR